MATLFADGFDAYASSSDMLVPVGQWTTGSSVVLTVPANTQFGIGQAASLLSASMSATFATSESTIYGSIRVFTSGTSSSSNYGYLQFSDAGTAQCTIRWNTDGSVGLYTGGPTGTLIQTFTSIFSNTVWNSYQFKVIIHPTAGEISVRMNGSTTAVVSRTGINTRTTANSSANGFIYGSSAATVRFDDLYFNNTSGNQPTSWVGDLRALQQIPTTTTQSQLSLAVTTTTQIVASPNTSTNPTANTVIYSPFTALYTGTISSIILTMNSNLTGNVKLAVYDNTGTGGTPGTAIGSVSINNPVAGDNTIAASIPVIGNSIYYMATDQDATASYKAQAAISTSYNGTTTYASFPVNNPSGLTNLATMSASRIAYTLSDNTAGVQELIEDGDTTYVYTSSTGEDKYSMKPITATYNVVAVQPYMMYRRSDVGPRTLALSIAANGSSDTAVITDSVVGNLAYYYKFVTLENDPTGAAWTPSSVNGAVLGLTAG